MRYLRSAGVALGVVVGAVVGPVDGPVDGVAVGAAAAAGEPPTPPDRLLVPGSMPQETMMNKVTTAAAANLDALPFS
jgi:hypothetical protein